MFFQDDEERDTQDLDIDEDADFDNSDDDEDPSNDQDGSDDEEDDVDDGEEDDPKPNKRDDSSDSKGKKNRDAAARRKSSKSGHYKEQQRTADRLAALELSEKKRDLLEKKRTFGYENNLSPKQVDFVFRNTKRPTPKFLEQPEISAGLEAIKRSESIARNTPSSNAPVYKDRKGKEVAFKDLPATERQSRFAERRRSILEQKGR